MRVNSSLDQITRYQRAEIPQCLDLKPYQNGFFVAGKSLFQEQRCVSDVKE